MISNLIKYDNESMDEYLITVKTIATSLATIRSRVYDLKLIQHTAATLQHSPEYEGFLIAYFMLPVAHSFDNLLSKSIDF